MAIALWLGLVAGSGLGARGAWACLAGALVLGALAHRALPRTGAALVTLVAALAGAARGAGHERRLDAVRGALPGDDAFVRVVATLESPAQREADAPRAIARVIAATPALPRGALVRLVLPASCDADWGDTLRALVRLSRYETARNPGGFDARSAANATGLVAQGRAMTASVSPGHDAGHLAARLAMRVRRAMEAALARGLSPGARELASPLVFGDRSAMSPELDAKLRGSGLVHLLALSGLHVVWLAAVARGIAALFGRGVAARALAGAACAAAYALLAGPLPSLMRAVAGEGVTALARLGSRALDPVQSLAIGTLALLGAHPGWAHDLGFQLSCAATLGIVTLASPLASPLSRWRPGRAIVSALAVTAAAQLAALPILLARFHALPWTGLASNLVAVPVSELLLAAAWLGGLADAVLAGSGALVLHACEPLAWALRGIASLAASWPGALAATGADPAPPWLASAGVALLMFALPAPRELDARQRGAGASREIAAATGALLVGCAMLAAFVTRPLAPPPGRWWIVGIDVGQGDALAIALGNEWWLVDAGPRSPRWDAGEGAVLPFMRWAGVRSLARLVLTHDDGDHTGGAPAVLRSLAVRETDASAPRPGVPGPAAKFRAVTLGRGDTLRREPPARVLWPPRVGERGEAVSRRGDNAAALVIEVGGEDSRALLMSDVDSLVEEQLDVPAGVAVLKAGHHGSGSSSGAAFVRRARPSRVLLSVGRHNVYGHPDPGALARLGGGGAFLDRTDRDGAIWYELGGGGAARLDWRACAPRPMRASGPPLRARPSP